MHVMKALRVKRKPTMEDARRYNMKVICITRRSWVQIQAGTVKYIRVTNSIASIGSYINIIILASYSAIFLCI